MQLILIPLPTVVLILKEISFPIVEALDYRGKAQQSVIDRCIVVEQGTNAL